MFFSVHWLVVIVIPTLTLILLFLTIWFFIAWHIMSKRARLIDQVLNALANHDDAIAAVKEIEKLMRKTRYHATKS